MVVDKVCCMPIATILAVALSTRKTFLFHHLFYEDGQGFVELLKGEKLNQMLLKFIPLCSHGIHNFIISLKHHPGNFSSIEYILKLNSLFGYDYIKDNLFLGQQDR
jgi:hypothetical protein